MKYTDLVYGKSEIYEPVILELIASPSLQRLKGINQYGYLNPFLPVRPLSRFEHSIGVFLLLRKFQASLEEQVAGLIHDVSHSAFSHCIDYVLEEGSQKEHTHQDNIFEDFVNDSEIPLILKKYNLDTHFVLNDKNFPLKEKELPNLCADRIDYSFRSFLLFGEASKKEVDNFLDNLIIQQGNWAFKNFKIAKKYTELFYSLNEKYFCGLPTALMFCTVGDYLKYGLEKKYITKKDLYTTDNEILVKIGKHLKTDKYLSLLFERMNNKIDFKNDKNDFESHIFCKSRVVDPFFIKNNKLVKVSRVDSKLKNKIKGGAVPKEYFLKFEK